MHYDLFQTAFGTCAIAWSETGLTHLRLPESSGEENEARMQRFGAERVSTRPPDFVQDAQVALRTYFEGSPVDLSELRLDESRVSSFNASVYRALRAVPRGSTVTYGDLAAEVGQRNAARAVGMAMGRNPWPVIVPCHRVLASGGRMGGFSAPGGTTTKEKLLALEGVVVGDPVLPGLFETDTHD